MTYLMIQEALSGKRGKDQQRIAQESTRSLEILLKKNHDYGGSAWKKPILCPNLDVGTAILVRMSDKIERLQKLLPKDTTPQIEESVEDTMRDLGNYCQLWLARPKEKEKEKEKDDAIYFEKSDGTVHIFQTDDKGRTAFCQHLHPPEWVQITKEQYIQAKLIEKLNPTDGEKETCLRRNTIPAKDCDNAYYKTPDGEVVTIPLHHNLQIPSDWLLATEGSKEEKEIADRAVTIREEFTNIEEPGFSVKVDPDKDYGITDQFNKEFKLVDAPSDRHENQ